MKWSIFGRNLFETPGNHVPGQENDKLRKMRFDDIIEMTHSLLTGVSGAVEQAAIYDFIIWTLGCQIAADSRGIFIHRDDPPENRYYNLKALFPEMEGAALGTEDIDLSKVPTYTGLWDRNRFSNGILSIFTRGYQQELANNNGVYFRELNFAVMLEGRHHTSWGIYAGECIQSLQVITLDPYFPVLETDGAYFTYKDDNGNTAKRKAIDYRLAAMYELAKQKWKLSYPADLSQRVLKNRNLVEYELTRQRCILRDDEAAVHKLVAEQTRLRSLLYCKEEEIQHLQAQCAEERKYIQELEQHLSSSK